MQLRWTEEAAADLERIADHLFDHAPQSAPRVLQLIYLIYEAPAKLLGLPLLGRPGRRGGTREMILPSVPYLVLYTVSADTLHIVRVLHGAQEWP